MHALVIYESMFGNTRKVAEAIAEGLATSAKVDLREVGAAPATIEGGMDLLVVGGPTHAFSMSRPRTREDARRETATVSTADGLREWIAALDRSGRRVPVATFDTKVARPNLPGSAARAAERRLRKLGFPIARRPEASSSTARPARCCPASSSVPVRGARSSARPQPNTQHRGSPAAARITP